MTPQDRESQIRTICLIVLTAFAIGVVLYWLRPVLVPFVLAVFVTVAMMPLIDLQTRSLRVPLPLAVASSVIFTVLLLMLVGIIASVSVTRLVGNVGLYQQQIGVLISNALDRLPLEQLGIDESYLLGQMPSQVGAALLGTGNALIDILSNGFLVVVFVIFLLIGRSGQAPTSALLAEVEERVKRYVGVKFLISLATAFSVGTVLQLLGIPFALMFGLLVFLLNFIPSIGSVIATLLPLPVVLVQPEISGAAAVLAIALPGAIQITMGNFIEPKIYGESLDLHPVVTLMSLVLWGTLWGIVGMFLAAPMAAVIKIFLARLEHTAPIAEAMGGRLEALFGEESA
ncbi:MAG TPA: AI-2E family transporter [Acidobacteriota bacterium]|nr:AI-2E family transporter [Acidobacteriota bacterium]